jgi:outer membrane protein assembly factor BamB
MLSTTTAINRYKRYKLAITMKRLSVSALVGVLLFGFAVSLATAEDWNRFRGPHGSGVADGDLPSSWTDNDYRWTVDLGSRDIASPIVQGDSIYVLVSKPDQRKIEIQSRSLASGAVNWSRSYDQVPHHLHARNTLASSTPATDSKHVYFAYAENQHTWLIAVDHDGQEVWKRDFGPWQSQHGFGTSPRIAGDNVVLLLSQQAQKLDPGQVAGDSRVVAVHRDDGNDAWQTPLIATQSCYGTLASDAQTDSRWLYGANTGNGLFAIDSKTGVLAWDIKVFSKRCCSSPLVYHDEELGVLVIGTEGSGGGGNKLVVVQNAKSGQQPRELYRIERNAPYVPTPVVHQGRLYMIDDRGIASCADVRTGDVFWTKRISGNFSASPILVGDSLLMIDLKGKATVLEAADKFVKRGSIDLGSPVGATPAYSDGKLILRVGTQLRCL